jgi:hypothetical protein
MPTEVVGALALRKALRDYAPDLATELRKEVAAALKPVVARARGYAPSDTSIMSGWQRRSFSEAKFPMYDVNVVRKGISYKTSPSRANSRGFSALAAIENKSAIGAIIETAGRKNKDGQPWVGPGKNVGQKRYSHSVNDEAGKQFIKNLGKIYGEKKTSGIGDKRGRLIYRAWSEQNGKVIAAYFKAVENVTAKFNKRTSIVDVKRAA